MNTKIMYSVIAIVAGCASDQSLAKAPEELSAIVREVSIMENILSTALKQDTDNKVRAINANYFAKQGVVFELDITAGNRWHAIFSGAPEAPLPPMPDIDFSDVNIEFLSDQVEIISEHAVESSRDAYHHAMEVMREGAEKVRDIAEQERDVSREIRDLEREKRDLEFATRHDNSAEVKELVSRKNSLEKEIKALEKQQTKLTKEQKKARQAISAKHAQREKQKVAEQEQLLEKISQSISLTLCDYGSGLRSLPNDEYVSFVLDGLGQKDKNLIKIFNKGDIKKCVIGETKASELALKAISYQF
ncbi:hypothetical protein [Pseudoalteromonas sp. H105]|jgi:hypothetical protein|uniref:hypothetical protein n=1 Tax=Pseudoalteromonas sp. H105 TaxID=1348393 RepID=UPI000731F5B5|nr:hypothetical protein [Pseudoalteromonas sp. H105]KTF15258.1 hypothetical protein ATS75_10755 [Pseudoalteromonas sp. H105]